ncbi:hypothetical protein Tco_0655237 [Tanacetum coccineum]|uniref:Uncharacterized protein n=1 Tax=Tanacetum coccineum TaxID=301880 RepID=A0ABQ4X5W9_9ASTR
MNHHTIISTYTIGIMKQRGSSGTGSLPIDLTGDEDPTDEDGGIGMGDSTGVSVSLGGEISSGGKKYQKSNIGDSDNTGDGGTTVGEKTSEAKSYLVKSYEESGEVFHGEAGK